MPLALQVLAGCGHRSASDPVPPPESPPPASFHFDRLLVLPVLSLGNLERVRPAARQSLVLAFSSRTDSLVLLRERAGASDGHRGEERDVPVPVDSLYTTPCDPGLLRERLDPEQSHLLDADDLYALCADVGYSRHPPESDTMQVAKAVGRIWSGDRDSVVWRDSASVTVDLERSELAPDTIAGLLKEAILRLRDRLP